MQNFLADIMTQLMQEQDHLLGQICQTQAEASSEYQTHIIELMAHQADRLRHISQLFTAHKSDIRPLHLAQFIRHLLGLLQGQLTRVNVNVSLTCDENLIIDGSSWQYLQFFYRLISNTLNHAFKEHNQSRVLHINITRQANTLHLQLEDNGVGMTELQLNQLRQEMSQDLCLGTLTCLSLWVKNDLNGVFYLESELNKGTRVVCSWPL